MEDFVKVSLSDTSKLQRFQMLEVSGSESFSERGRLSLQTSLRSRSCTQNRQSSTGSVVVTPPCATTPLP